MSDAKAAEATVDRPHYDAPPAYSASAPPQNYGYDPGSQSQSQPPPYNPPGQSFSPQQYNPPGQQFPPQQYNPPGQSFPPHQQQYVQQQPPQVIVRVIQNQNFYSEPARVICQFCQADVRTRVRRKNNLTTHLSALLLLFFCCPLFWIPYCSDCCKDAVHECPSCDRFLGEYRQADRRRY